MSLFRDLTEICKRPININRKNIPIKHKKLRFRNKIFIKNCIEDRNSCLLALRESRKIFFSHTNHYPVSLIYFTEETRVKNQYCNVYIKRSNIQGNLKEYSLYIRNTVGPVSLIGVLPD